MPITDADLENWFTYHAPESDQQVQQYGAIRRAGLEMARVILHTTPPSPDQTVAIRKIREAVMVANASIACGGR